jgi:pimeloyl-ACP methyl ester carboxylesterase
MGRFAERLHHAAQRVPLLQRFFPFFFTAAGPILHIASDVGAGPVVILLHGIASSSQTFKDLLPLLTGHHRCISIDLLGFGESPAGTDYTIEEHVEAISATVRSLRLRAPFTLVGHSLGSLLSSRYAAQYPAQLSHLVMVSPPIYPDPSELGNRVERMQMGAYLRAYEFLRTNKLFTIGNAARVARLLKISEIFEISERNWDAFVKSLQNCIESQTTVSDVARVQVPVDVVYGAQDQFIAMGTMRVLERLRNVTVHRVELNDHLVRPRLARVVAAVIDPAVRTSVIRRGEAHPSEDNLDSGHAH